MARGLGPRLAILNIIYYYDLHFGVAYMLTGVDLHCYKIA